MIALPLVGRKPAHRHALLERHRPRVDQRQAPRAGLGIDVGDLGLPARRRRRRPAADHTQARHGKAVFLPDRPLVFKTRNLCPNSATLPANYPELRNLHPNRTSLSRPVEDCDGCPALARIRSLGLDDPSADRPDLLCKFGDRRIRAGLAAAACPICHPLTRRADATSHRRRATHGPCPVCRPGSRR